jgi:hypothetical protein
LNLSATVDKTVKGSLRCLGSIIKCSTAKNLLQEKCACPFFFAGIFI